MDRILFIEQILNLFSLTLSAAFKISISFEVFFFFYIMHPALFVRKVLFARLTCAIFIFQWCKLFIRFLLRNTDTVWPLLDMTGVCLQGNMMIQRHLRKNLAFKQVEVVLFKDFSAAGDEKETECFWFTKEHLLPIY